MTLYSLPFLTPPGKKRSTHWSALAKMLVTPRTAPARAGLNATTTQLRGGIAEVMNSEMVGCSIEEFLNHYMPKCNKKTVISVIANLKKENVLVPRAKSKKKKATVSSSEDGRKVYSHIFNNFRPPAIIEESTDANSTEKPNEIMVFDSLATIGASVIESLRKVKGATVNGHSIRMCPHARLKSPIEGDFLITDIAVPFEFKLNRSPGEVYQNRIQLASHVNHTMTDDARRKWTYGITIENDRVSLWYFSRSHSAKSRSFSMVEHPDIFVQILVSLFSATDEQLGFDPLVTLVGDKDYVYEFPPSGERTDSNFYLTLGSLSEFRVLNLIGRNTRIWKVMQVVSAKDRSRVPGTHDMILKDVSLYRNTPTEGDIQRGLFLDIDTFGKTEWRKHELLKDLSDEGKAALAQLLEGDGKKYRDYFSCVIDEHVGGPSLPVASEAWDAPDTFKNVEPVEENATESIRKDQATKGLDDDDSESDWDDEFEDDTDCGGSVESTDGDELSRPFEPKQQCRLIYKDVCTPLHNVHTMGEAIDILEQCLLVLTLMFCAGWVHRDISTGNILAHRSAPGAPWRVKLSDLEYAKRFPGNPTATASTEVKTGTMYFMATEVQQSQVLLPGVPGTNGAVIAHNYQHDLESIWWIVLWLVTMRVKQNLPRIFGKETFQQTMTITYIKARIWCLTNPLTGDKNLLASLPRTLRSTILHGLENVREDLQHEYTKRNQSQEQNVVGSYSRILGITFPSFFSELRARRDEWEFVRLKVSKKVQKEELKDASNKLKRKAEKMEAAGNDDTDMITDSMAQSSNIVGDLRQYALLPSTRHHVQSKSVSGNRPTGPITRSMTKSSTDEAPRPSKRPRRR
ncbi:other/FunK1 protein kinase [Coprinopsis cinerea okayama7|uniref:Other/FunK1 protein kinase n=1 Tax=Coprinopsis cinerea (strain Okayama-7 / 130 / ATCC MYA-4618 / FGSC 9003) TaxID=240176 RepID=A8NAX9_COPC7|nr:other/FunK1 protein kinase [Coprinopsis cinerea okayama7\|eukprot:XP_001831981.2 other/FunK1 protein kinase [Coprinopsis cinerea okayama7\